MIGIPTQTARSAKHFGHVTESKASNKVLAALTQFEGEVKCEHIVWGRYCDPNVTYCEFALDQNTGCGVKKVTQPDGFEIEAGCCTEFRF
jgi:hypothetical protein